MITKSCCVETMAGNAEHCRVCVQAIAHKCRSIFRYENKCGADNEVWEKICAFDENNSATPDVTIAQVQGVVDKINAWLKEETDKRIRDHRKQVRSVGNDRFHYSMLVLPK